MPRRQAGVAASRATATPLYSARHTRQRSCEISPSGERGSLAFNRLVQQSRGSVKVTVKRNTLIAQKKNHIRHPQKLFSSPKTVSREYKDLCTPVEM